MIDASMIPDEVCLGLLHALLGNPQPTPQTVRAALAAALNAWPGVWEYTYHDDGSLALILSLPKDAADE